MIKKTGKLLCIRLPTIHFCSKHHNTQLYQWHLDFTLRHNRPRRKVHHQENMRRFHIPCRHNPHLKSRSIRCSRRHWLIPKKIGRWDGFGGFNGRSERHALRCIYCRDEEASRGRECRRHDSVLWVGGVNQYCASVAGIYLVALHWNWTLWLAHDGQSVVCSIGKQKDLYQPLVSRNPLTPILIVQRSCLSCLRRRVGVRHAPHDSPCRYCRPKPNDSIVVDWTDFYSWTVLQSRILGWSCICVFLIPHC